MFDRVMMERTVGLLGAGGQGMIDQCFEELFLHGV